MVKPNAEVLLRKLLCHFSQFLKDEGLQWKYIEGTEIREIESVEFENYLIEFMRDNKLDDNLA